MTDLLRVTGYDEYVQPEVSVQPIRKKSFIMNLSLAVFLHLSSTLLYIHLQKDERIQFDLFYLAQQPQCPENITFVFLS